MISYILHKNIILASCMLLLTTLFISSFVIIPIHLHMALYILPILIIGSHRTLELAQQKGTTNEIESPEFITKRQAMLFPFIGSFFLFSLYCLFKFLDPWWVNFFIKSFIIIIQFSSLSSFLQLSFENFVPAFMSKTFFTFNINFQPIASKENPKTINLSYFDIIINLISILTAIFWIYTHSWVLHNIFAISICIQSISLIYGGSFTILTILLCGLFVYDIFWVFGTHVMVSVASAIDAPVVIIFPTKLAPWSQTILGLGDVVIPGIFIAMCLRFDFYIYLKSYTNKLKNDNKEELQQQIVDIAHHLVKDDYKKFYFWVVLFFYQLGMITTGAIMFFFNHPQPALLYLVPYCLLSLYGAAVLNGDIKDLLNYADSNIFDAFTNPILNKEIKQE